MSEERFEEEVEYSNYDYTLLDTHYEAREKRIIEWNKHSSNAEYFNNDLEGIAELLNIKQMKLEGITNYDIKVGGLLDKIENLEKSNEELNISINLFEADISEKDKQIKQLQKQLNFIQNAISDAIQHQKTELGQKALKEIIFDYNEFLLGHKGVE